MQSSLFSARTTPTPSQSLPLHPHQVDALAAIHEARARGVTRQLVSIATGGGKSLLAATLIAEREYQSVVFLVHRDELVRQTEHAIHQADPGLSIGIVKAERNECYADVVIASVQTLAHRKRRDQLVASMARKRLLIVDECHHASANTYVDTIDAIDADLLVGLTATAYRADQRALSQVFDEVVYHYPMIPLIAAGRLANLVGLRIDTEADLDTVHVRAGEFIESELADSVDTESRNQLVVRTWREHAWNQGRDRTVAFCVNVAHAEHLRDTFRADGVDCEMVLGVTPTEERQRIFQRFHDGELPVLVNVGVLCLDDQTEILTDRGWVGKDEITMDHQVANWEDGRIWFTPPEEIVRRPLGLTEHMVSAEGRQHSIRVTDSHRMLYRTWKVGQFLKVPASELVGRKVQLPTTGMAAPRQVAMEQPMERSKAQCGQLLARTAWNLRTREGYGQSESYVEARRRNERRTSLRYKEPHELTLADCRLIGFWVGDGSVNHLRRGGVEYLLAQSTAYPLIIEWIDQTIRETGIHALKRAVRAPSRGGEPSVTWSLPRGTGGGSQQREGVYAIEPYLDKAGSPLLWGLNAEQFKAFLDGLWHADGNHHHLHDAPSYHQITGANYQLLSTIQAIATCRAIRTRLLPEKRSRKNPRHRQVYRLNYGQRGGGIELAAPAGRLQAEETWRDEEVWCVRVPGHNIVTRRHGAVVIMGNTEGWDEPAANCGLMTRPTKSLGLYTQCLDLETEILTPRGFLGPDELRDTDLIAGVDPTTRATRWLPQLSRVRRPVAPGERMVTLASPSLDIRVTDGHRMLVSVYSAAHRGVGTWSSPHFVEAGNLVGVPGAIRLPVSALEDVPDCELTDAEIGLLGWFLSDGSLDRANNAVYFGQAAHQPQIEHLRKCLQESGLRYGEQSYPHPLRPTTTMIRFSVSRGEPRRLTDRHLHGWAHHFDGWLDKRLTPAYERLSARQFEILLYALHLGNGTKHQPSDWTPRSYHITTGHRAQAEGLQALGVRRGWRINVATVIPKPEQQRDIVATRPCFTMHAKKIADANLNGRPSDRRPTWQFETPDSPEEVWCVENELGTLITRRGGKVVILGNCVGRLARAHGGKKDALIIDYCDLSSRHSLVSLPTLAGKEAREAAGETEREEDDDGQDGRGDGEQLGLMEMVQETLRVRKRRAVAVDLFGQSPYAWHEAGAHWMTSTGDGYLTLVPVGDGFMPVEIRRGRGQADTYRRLFDRPLDMETARSVAEALVPQNPLTDREAAWRVEAIAPSQKQLDFAHRLRIDVPRGVTKGQLSELIDLAMFAQTMRRLKL